jgi:hypothetical protein
VALLSSMMRVDEFTGGRAGAVDAWFAGRQSGRWLTQPARASAAPDAARTLAELTDLRRRGALTDDELERFRARLHL